MTGTVLLILLAAGCPAHDPVVDTGELTVLPAGRPSLRRRAFRPRRGLDGMAPVDTGTGAKADERR